MGDEGETDSQWGEMPPEYWVKYFEWVQAQRQTKAAPPTQQAQAPLPEPEKPKEQEEPPLAFSVRKGGKERRDSIVWMDAANPRGLVASEHVVEKRTFTVFGAPCLGDPSQFARYMYGDDFSAPCGLHQGHYVSLEARLSSKRPTWIVSDPEMGGHPDTMRGALADAARADCEFPGERENHSEGGYVLIPAAVSVDWYCVTKLFNSVCAGVTI